MELEEKKSNGALIGSIIIIIILIAGGIYVWQSKVQKALEMKNAQSANVLTPADDSALDGLEQDLGTTDTSVNVDVNAIQ